ncbi:MAG: DUF1345 domain-containing protein [Candidatus Sericytochromatia bacterium]|nr:DUF1345 domain-containing protein [Candidatus Sericytochromatia bacterium]
MPTPQVPFLLRLTASSRLAHASAFALATGWLTITRHGVILTLLATWDAFALAYLVLIWGVVVQATPEHTRAYAKREDPSRRTIFTLLLLGSIASFFAAVVFLDHSGTLSSQASSLFYALCIAALVMGWLLTHTLYALHYAHLYYGSGHSASGLAFPGDEEPDDFDFIYFAITIGMTFQVSDIVITQRRLRRVVIRHAMLSFVFATVIIAITINLVASRL